MTIVLGASIAVLLWTLAAALRLLRRTGEARVGLAAAVAAPLGLAAAAFLAESHGHPLGLDLSTALAIAILGASLAALLSLRAFAVTLEELDLAEALHWGSMQGVRALTQIAAERRGEADDRLAALLELGCERFGVEVGLLARTDGDHHEIQALRAPEGFPLAQGERLPLDGSLLRHALSAERPVALEAVSTATWASPTEADPLGFETFLGAAVSVGERPFGVLAFGDRAARGRRFTASHKDLLALMAQWAGVEVERREGLAARETVRGAGETVASGAGETVASDVGEAVASAAPAARMSRGRRGIDLNEVLRRVEQRIRDLAPPRVRLVVHASAEPAVARPCGVPPESLLLTLVGHALDAMQGAGTLTLASALSAGWVTISLSHTGRGPRPEELSLAFAPGPAASRDALALAPLVRALRRGGGDLSVAVDPKRGSTFTLFLPAAARAVRAPGDARTTNTATAAAPPPPS